MQEANRDLWAALTGRAGKERGSPRLAASPLRLGDLQNETSAPARRQARDLGAAATDSAQPSRGPPRGHSPSEAASHSPALPGPLRRGRSPARPHTAISSGQAPRAPLLLPASGGLCFPGPVPQDQPAGPSCCHTEPDLAWLLPNRHIQGSACWGRGPE